MSTTRYTSAGHRPVDADSERDAAEIYALRKARAVFGGSARVAALHLNGWCGDGSFSEWSAFIGYPSGPRETTGRNVIFTVWKD